MGSRFCKGEIMRRAVLLLPAFVGTFVLGRSVEQAVQTFCDECQSTYLSADEIQQYLEVASADQQIRSVDIGKAQVQVAISHRGRLERPGGVAEHDLVTEVYYVISGSATNVTGSDLVDAVPRGPNNRAVQFLNGPGHNATAIRNGTTHELSAGDILVIPAGTGHQFTRIDDHIRYVMIRIDPDKVVPLMDEVDSREYLRNR
jgi:mannose-6-phosphate isomerase-like protein (cupin superfamily)